MAALPGGASKKVPNGSVFSRTCPRTSTSSNLYHSPALSPGMKSSHTPDAPNGRIGW